MGNRLNYDQKVYILAILACFLAIGVMWMK
jgi:hypothetical protein